MLSNGKIIRKLRHWLLFIKKMAVIIRHWFVNIQLSTVFSSSYLLYSR